MNEENSPAADAMPPKELALEEPALEEPSPLVAAAEDTPPETAAGTSESALQSVAQPAMREVLREQEGLALSYGGLRRFLFLVVLLLVGAALARAVMPILVLFGMVFLLAAVLNPLVSWLEARGLKRGLAVVLILLGLLGVIALVIWLIVPPILDQVNQLVAQAPDYWQRINTQVGTLAQRYPALNGVVDELQNFQNSAPLEPAKLGPYLTRAVSFTFGFIGAIFLGIVALLLLVFTLSNPQPLLAGFLSAVPVRYRNATGRSLARIQQQMTAWAKATMINGLITGVSTGVLLHLVGVKPALVFGVLAFFGEFVPNIGPLVAAIPALFVALGIGPDKFLLALGVILFVQQVESNVLVPFIMGRQMELHPVTIVFFALAMASLLGIIGAIIAVPTAAIIKILIDEFYFQPQNVPRDRLEAGAQALVMQHDWPEIP